VGRVRPPRVQITYDVETGGAMRKVELPFVVGVLADLSGMPKEPPKALKDRKFIPIDRDNFNKVMEKMEPRLAMRVENKLTGGETKLGAELTFKSMDDFEPARVAEQIPALKELLDMRHKLNQLLSKMEGNQKLEQMLEQILGNAEQRVALAQKYGAAGAEETPKPEAKPEETK
jgi:type VI secretion system protein ImpB